LFVAVSGVRFSVGSEEPITLLYCLPVALLAVAFGLLVGVAAGLVALSLVAVYVAVADLDLSLVGWATRAVPLLLLGGLLGDAVDRLRRSERERRRLEWATQRHRDAVEINDSVVQGLAAAKWALEADRTDRGLEILTRTLEDAERLVSDLLRDADMGPGGARGRPRIPG
jgi:signal transduction histidine kinase